MKKFRHKTMGRVAEKKDHLNSGDYTIDALDANYSQWSKAYPDLRVVRTIPKELIENSQDREEVVEETIPDSVRFMESYCKPLGLQVGKEEQILFYKDTWQVTNNQKGGRGPVKCRLQKTPIRDLKVGQFVLDVYGCKDNPECYVLVTKVKEDGYEGMVFTGRVISYMGICALTNDPLVVVPLSS